MSASSPEPVLSTVRALGAPSAAGSDRGRDGERDDRSVLARFVEYRRSRSIELRNELVEEHVRLAEHLARRFSYRGEALDDLRQVALIGLLKAVERFDPERGVLFSSFATPTVLGELKRHFRDRGWAMRVPRRVQELHLQMGRAIGRLTQDLGRPPTPAELAQHSGVTEEDVLEGMEAASLYRLPSIDAGRPDDDNGGGGLAATIGADDPDIVAVEHRLVIEELLTHLEPRERRIVYLRFYEGLTQAEIAEQVGISQMHVSRLLARSLETLGAHLAPEVAAGERERPGT